MVSRCRSTIGKRPANTTCDTFRSIPTDENGASAKVEQSTPNLISCGPCTSGVTRSSRMRSRCDLSENRAAPCQCDCFADGLTPSISFLPTAEMEGHAGKSEKGQSRRFDDVRATSAFPLIADVRQRGRHVGLVPLSDSCTAAKAPTRQLVARGEMLRVGRLDDVGTRATAARPTVLPMRILQLFPVAHLVYEDAE